MRTPFELGDKLYKVAEWLEYPELVTVYKMTIKTGHLWRIKVIYKHKMFNSRYEFDYSDDTINTLDEHNRGYFTSLDLANKALKKIREDKKKI